jgi:hypothetical protein
VTQPLVDPSDAADFANWAAGDKTVLISMANAEVQKYCGWHIAPSVTVTSARCWFGNRDLIMLPSAHVTAISSVTIDGTDQVADTDYYWDAPNAWIRRRPRTWPHDMFATISFTHGYATTPADVKAVVFELVSTAAELPASNATEFQTMQYNIKLRKEIGMELTEGQKHRLGRYHIPRFGASGMGPEPTWWWW